jgi:hypothetical protein
MAKPLATMELKKKCQSEKLQGEKALGLWFNDFLKLNFFKATNAIAQSRNLT